MTVFDSEPLGLFLERLLRRSRLGQPEQEAILGLKAHAACIDAHRVVLLPGRDVDHVSLVADGLAARFDQTSDGRRQYTAIHLPGDMCDLHAVAAPVPGWGIDALTTTTVLRIAHSDLRELVARYPDIGLAFWRDTLADASLSAKWMTNIGRKEARARIAHLLCELGVRMEQAGRGDRTRYSLAMTQDQLGDVLGLTAVHVNRTLMSLRAERLVRVVQREVHIEDWQRLAKVADFEPGYLMVDELAELRVA